MGGSVRIGRVLGVPLRMHWSVPVLVVLLAFWGYDALHRSAPGESGVVYTFASAVGAVLLMGSLLLHETAHAVTALRSKVSVEDVTLWALGGVTRMGRAQTARVAFAVAISGPLTSLLIAGVSIGAGFGLHALTGWDVASFVLVWLGWVNLVLGVFNLLPGAPLDGGRVVQAAVWWRTGDRDRAERAAARSGQVLGALLMAVGWIQVLRGATGGLWLTLVGFFILFVAGAERQRARLSTSLHGLRVADAMSSPVATGPDWLTVDRFIDEVAAYARHSTLALLDFEGRPSGTIQLRRLGGVPVQNRDSVRVRDVATPLSRCTLAAPEELLTEVLDRAAGKGLGGGLPILVMADGNLVGIVTAHDVSRLAQQSALSSPGSRQRAGGQAWGTAGHKPWPGSVR